MNMRKFFDDVKNSPVKKAMPVLSFPCVSLLGISVKDLVSNSENQSKGMKAVAERVDSLASVSMMDLSVEAEAFGSQIRLSDDEVPTVIGAIVSSEEEADALEIPEVGAGRTGIYLEAMKKSSELITDRPVFAGVIGPFSLAGRLMGVSEALIYCYEEPDMVHKVMSKVTEFLTKYMLAYKETTGASGVVMAEPLTGLMSGAMAEEFSAPYVKQIIDAVQSDDFAIVYHNCGNNAVGMIDSIAGLGAMGYHFGNAVDMYEVLSKMPEDAIVLGNIDPAGQICNGTPDSVREATTALLEKCGGFDNFVISTGCDVPPKSKWENIDAFFGAVNEFYSKK